jgi:hypothetical protein
MLKYYKEIILVEAILLLQCWWWAPYIAFLLTSILVPVFSAILLISILAEKIEKTRIEREYYLLVAGLAVLPVILLIAIWLAGGSPASYF